jgi:hypothetical protein
MKKKGIDFKHSKLRGEVAERRFMTRAAEMDCGLLNPGETAAGMPSWWSKSGRFQ